LLSTFRNDFGFAEVTGTRKSKRKTSFPFAFLSLFRNFAAKFTTELIKDNERLTAIHHLEPLDRGILAGTFDIPLVLAVLARGPAAGILSRKTFI
jgi:hypothetical protein